MTAPDLLSVAAHHEAGHAVAAVMRGGSELTSVSVDRDRPGHGIAWSRLHLWDRPFVIWAGPWAEARMLVLGALEDLPVHAPGLWWDVSAHHVGSTVGRHLRSVGVQASGHQLRHFAGTSWYRASGHDLLATAALLRHASVKTTMTYAGLDPTRGAEIVQAVGLPGLHMPLPGGAGPVELGEPGLRLIREGAS